MKEQSKTFKEVSNFLFLCKNFIKKFIDLKNYLLYDFYMEKLSEKLPEKFKERLQNSLGKDFDKYVEAIDKPSVRGVRVNTKKIAANEVEKIFEKEFCLKLEKVKYSSDGFILNSNEKFGNETSHLSGLYYFQEPSSMVPVCASQIEKEDGPLKVLDLCASPGGKTGQIACRVGDDSLIVSNEIISSRASVLFSNVERQGFKNVIVTNEEPEGLLCFEGFFDYVFVDAPCSGEGMFRRIPETISEWSEENVKMCAERQKQILEVAEKLVAAGGKLVYSTCTYAKEEDEEIVEWFVNNFNYELQDVPESVKKSTVASSANVKNAEFARKFYPFSGEGEGQFVAVFKNNDDVRETRMHTKKHFRAIEGIGRTKRVLFDEFQKENLTEKIDGRIYEVGETVYLVPKMFDGDLQTAVDTLKFNTIGVKVGSLLKGRFEPNHSIFMKHRHDSLFYGNDEVKKYLHGEEILSNITSKGYGVVTKNGYALGGVKIVNGRLKNLYPKGLRV